MLKSVTFPNGIRSYFFRFSIDDGQIEALEGKSVPLNLFGLGLTNDSEVVFTSALGSYGDSCLSDEFHVKTDKFKLEVNEDGTIGRIEIPGGAMTKLEGQDIYFVCLKTNGQGPFVHQGDSSPGLKIKVFTLLLPIWLMVIFIVILLCLSGLFSGNNQFTSMD